MEHLILTETSFFRQIAECACNGEMQESYNGFIAEVVSLCSGMANPAEIFFALSFAETELQYHKAMQDMDNSHGVYVRKALFFVRKMLKHLGTIHCEQMRLPQATQRKEKAHTPPIQWTGNAIDLVEMIYGINEMGCINDGNIPLKELAPILYSFFGVNSKDCYRFYTDIKRRKNESRTYFLDRMQEKLNERMRHDDELERMRR